MLRVPDYGAVLGTDSRRSIITCAAGYQPWSSHGINTVTINALSRMTSLDVSSTDARAFALSCVTSIHYNNSPVWPNSSEGILADPSDVVRSGTWHPLHEASHVDQGQVGFQFVFIVLVDTVKAK
jgi:hypothetical protein